MQGRDKAHMLKRDPRGKFMYREVGIFHKKRLWRFYTGKMRTEGELEEQAYLDTLELQKSYPVSVMRDVSSKKRWWMFKDEFYWEDDGYTADEVKALVLDRLGQKERKVKRAVARLSQNESGTMNLREPIPDDVKLFVWQRDGGRCAKCRSQRNLEYDHIIPIAQGGSNTARNIQLLCEACNRSKGANLV
jgi:hypothetical protein